MYSGIKILLDLEVFKVSIVHKVCHRMHSEIFVREIKKKAHYANHKQTHLFIVGFETKLLIDPTNEPNEFKRIMCIVLCQLLLRIYLLSRCDIVEMIETRVSLISFSWV